MKSARLTSGGAAARKPPAGASEGDSTGKYGKTNDYATRRWMVIAAFVIGISVGLMLSERLYLVVHAPPQVKSAPTEVVVQANRLLETEPTACPVCEPAPAAEGGTCSQDGAIPEETLAAAREKYPELHDRLQKFAPQKEVLVAISNMNLVNWGGMLNTWIEGVQRSEVPNFVVAAIDKQLFDYLEEKGVPVVLVEATIAKSQEGTGDNHAVSALKFGILQQFLELGWSVLLSDVDVAVLRNPFDVLYRDRDVEGMSDGFDARTAYGFIDGHDDPSMGWARYAQAVKHFNLNSGTFWLKANTRTIELMARLADRLSKQQYWDQTAFNEEIFFLTHGDYKSPNTSVRVMEINTIMNSKTMFKFARHDAALMASNVPAMVHINYHPDKHERMKAVIDYFHNGNKQALAPFPGGSEPGS